MVGSLESFQQLGAVAEVDNLAVAFGAGNGLPPVLVHHGELLSLRGKLNTHPAVRSKEKRDARSFNDEAQRTWKNDATEEIVFPLLALPPLCRADVVRT